MTSGPSVHWWHFVVDNFVVDNLDIHRSVSLGRYVATESTLELDLARGRTRAKSLQPKQWTCLGQAVLYKKAIGVFHQPAREGVTHA